MLLDLLANQPPDFFHDPFGQFIINIAVALIVGLSTAIVALWVFRRQKTRKEISYQIISDAPIATVSKGLENQVTILFNGHSVENARQVVIKIRNAGNIAIRRDDYDEPIRFTFKNSEIIGTDILNTEPEELINSVDKKTFVTLINGQGEIIEQEGRLSLPLESEVQLEKFLLNPKQAITLTFLLDRAYKELQVRGRIVDGQIEKDVGSGRRAPLITTFTAIVAILIMAIIFATYLFGFSWLGFSNKTVWDWLQLLAILAIPVTVGFGVAWYTRMQQMRDR